MKNLNKIVVLCFFEVFFGTVFGQNSIIKYRGSVICESVEINDTIRLVCETNTHPSNYEILNLKETEYMTGELKQFGSKSILWNGEYAKFNEYGEKIENCFYLNGLEE